MKFFEARVTYYAIKTLPSKRYNFKIVFKIFRKITFPMNTVQSKLTFQEF